MNRSSLALRLKTAFLSADDGLLMRGAFFGLLAAAGTFLFVDLREMSLANAARPGHDPMATDAPVLPPALTEGVPGAPPMEPETSREILRRPIRFELLPGGMLKAEGSIDPGAADRFAEEIAARGEYVKAVTLNSPGGSVEDALTMSKLIREKGLKHEGCDQGALRVFLPPGVCRRRGARSGRERHPRRASGLQCRRGAAALSRTGHVRCPEHDRAHCPTSG